MITQILSYINLQSPFYQTTVKDYIWIFIFYKTLIFIYSFSREQSMAQLRS